MNYRRSLFQFRYRQFEFYTYYGRDLQTTSIPPEYSIHQPNEKFV